MTLGQLVNSKAALETLLKGSLPIGVAWELKKFVKTINTELTIFEELKNEKIKELGEEVMEDGKSTGSIQVKPENLAEFTNTITELRNKEVEAKIPQIKVDSLKDLTISTKDLIALDWLI